jgi:hypothetical protein
MSDFNPDDLTAADDLLQMMYWLRGEKLASAADVATLERMSGLDPARLQRAILTLGRRGLLERLVIEEDIQYRLTEEGVREGGRRFADEFADLTKPGHGECGDPDCDCQRTGSPEDCRHRVAGLE